MFIVMNQYIFLDGDLPLINEIKITCVVIKLPGLF